MVKELHDETERLSTTDIKLTRHKSLIRSVMT